MRQSGVMRLKDWIKKDGRRLEDLAPIVGVTPSNLSKITHGRFWVTAETADNIRTLTNGEVTLDDLHDAWRDRREPEEAAQ